MSELLNNIHAYKSPKYCLLEKNKLSGSELLFHYLVSCLNISKRTSWWFGWKVSRGLGCNWGGLRDLHIFGLFGLN